MQNQQQEHRNEFPNLSGTLSPTLGSADRNRSPSFNPAAFPRDFPANDPLLYLDLGGNIMQTPASLGWNSSSQNPQPRPIPRASNSMSRSSGRIPEAPRYGGEAMTAQYSNGSTYSNVSRESYSTVDTASTTNSIFGSLDITPLHMASYDEYRIPVEAGSVDADFRPGNFQQDRQMYSTDESLLPQHSGRATRHTPSSLKWSQDTEFPHLYKFFPRGKPPYLELLLEWKVTEQTPMIVYLDEPNIIAKGVYPCMFPGICLGKKGERSSFSRPADLERHYIHVHGSSDSLKSYACGYKKCSRAKDPFNRKDHYRAHLRDFHKEDLGCAKREKKLKDKGERQWQESQLRWLAERKIDPTHWRCAKCLKKIYVIKDGWECQDCNLTCKAERIKARQRIAAEAHTASYCNACNGTTWIENQRGGLEYCPNCQQLEGSAYSALGPAYEIWEYQDYGLGSLGVDPYCNHFTPIYPVDHARLSPSPEPGNNEIKKAPDDSSEKAALTSVETTKAIATTIEPTNAVAASVEPTKAIATSIEPTKAAATSIKPVKAVATSAEPVKAIVASVEPTKAVVTSVDPTKAISTSTDPTKTVATSSEPIKATPLPIFRSLASKADRFLNTWESMRGNRKALMQKITLSVRSRSTSQGNSTEAEHSLKIDESD